MFKPSSVVITGAIGKQESIGYLPGRNVIDAGYQGEVIPVILCTGHSGLVSEERAKDIGSWHVLYENECQALSHFHVLLCPPGHGG